jgi:hypothetical protein
MTIKIQEAPQTPSYQASGIQVPANIATPQAAMDSVKSQQTQLNSVNNLSGGRRKRSHPRLRRSKHAHKSFIRTYKGRRYVSSHDQKGGSQGGQIAIPQVGSTCSSGPQCSGVQNANFTAINNQAQSNSINDAYATQQGGRRYNTKKYKHTRRRKPRHDQSLTTVIAYNIKKVLRKVFT